MRQLSQLLSFLFQVVLPEILRWYKKDFEASHLSSTDSHSSSTDPLVSLLLHIEPYMYPKTAAKLQNMLSTIKEVTFSPFCWKFGYRFEVALSTHERFLSTSSSLPRASSVPDSLHLSTDLSSVSLTQKKESWAKYPLNEAILEYVEKTTPLVAALMRLANPFLPKEKVVGNQQATGEEPSRLPKAKSEELDTGKQDQKQPPKEEEELPFKLALQNTAKFPALQRYLVSRFYTLAEMLTLRSGESAKLKELAGSYEIIKLDTKKQRSLGLDVLPEIPLFSLALSTDGNRDLQNAYLIGSDYLLRHGNFDDLIELISSSDLQGDGSGGPPIDFLISSAVLSKGGNKSFLARKLQGIYRELGIREFGFNHKRQAKPWTLLTLVQDSEELARLVLSHLKDWCAKDAIDLLELCLSRPPDNAAARKELENRREKLYSYQRVRSFFTPFNSVSVV